MPQPQRDDGGGLTKMAALSEDGSYGLNCGQQNAGRVTVLHVKLTETALKAIESHQKCSVSESSLRFLSSKPSRAGFGGLTQLVSAGKLGCHAQVKSDKVRPRRRRRVSVPVFLGRNLPSPRTRWTEFWEVTRVF